MVARVQGVELGATVGGDAAGQGGGVLARDEDAADHQVELDRVEDAVAVVGHLGDGGQRLGLGLLVGGVVGGAIEGHVTGDPHVSFSSLVRKGAVGLCLLTLVP